MSPLSPRAVEQAEGAGAAAPPAGSTTQESDFELGIEEMLPGLELHRTPERRGSDGPSREAPPAGRPDADGLLTSRRRDSWP